jgi:hypothetical protein
MDLPPVGQAVHGGVPEVEDGEGVEKYFDEDKLARVEIVPRVGHVPDDPVNRQEKN